MPSHSPRARASDDDYTRASPLRAATRGKILASQPSISGTDWGSGGIMKRVAVGIVGAGFAAHFHAHCYRRVAGIEVELRGVASANPEHARRFADEFHVARAHERVEDLVADPAVDLIDICAPNNLHVPLIELAAAA